MKTRDERAAGAPAVLPLPASDLRIDGPFAPFKVHALKFFMGAPDEPSPLRADAVRLAEIFTTMQRSFMLHLSKELARGNVSFAQYCLLGFLAGQKHLSMTEIAGRMGHTTAAATGLVDRLEKLGHVRRVHSSDDRRKILVQITASGSRLVAAVRDDMVSTLLKMMAQLDSNEQKSWLSIYEKVFAFCQNK